MGRMSLREVHAHGGEEEQQQWHRHKVLRRIAR